MTMQEMLEVANNAIEDNDSGFADGFINGYLSYYDTKHQLSRPHSVQAFYTFMIDNLFDKRKTFKLNAGFVFRWTAAFSENNPEYFFTSMVIPETIPITESLPVITFQ